MLNEIIRRIYESGEYAGIYANAEDTSKFMYGRIVACLLYTSPSPRD